MVSILFILEEPFFFFKPHLTWKLRGRTDRRSGPGHCTAQYLPPIYWVKAGLCPVGQWWGWDRNPASWPLYREAPNRRVRVMVYFGARAMLIFPPTLSISEGWSSRDGRGLGPGLFSARVASLGERGIVQGGGVVGRTPFPEGWGELQRPGRGDQDAPDTLASVLHPFPLLAALPMHWVT